MRPGVTRQRLYFETVEEVLGNTNKVLVDTKGTGNMIYLPLDKLTDRRLQTPHARRAATVAGRPRRDGRRLRLKRGRDRRGPSRPGDPLMSNRSYLAVIILGFLALVISMAAFTVRETDLAIKFRFGEIVRADYEPGLHFMMPLVNNVRKFDRRILTEDYPAEQFLTSEGKILRINFFVKWRITDVSRFYTSTAGGSEDVANRRLGEIVKDGIKGVIAKRTIQQVVAAERTEFLNEVRKVAEGNVAGLGVTLVDVRVKNIDLPEEVSESVFNRMRQDFARQAAQLRAEGSAVSEQTRAEADRQRTEILANAYRQAEIIKGEGDAAAADVYAARARPQPRVLRVPPFHAGLPPLARQAGRHPRDPARRRVLQVPEGIGPLTARSAAARSWSGTTSGRPSPSTSCSRA